jgi:hypothetical protein
MLMPIRFLPARAAPARRILRQGALRRNKTFVKIS